MNQNGHSILRSRVRVTRLGYIIFCIESPRKLRLDCCAWIASYCHGQCCFVQILIQFKTAEPLCWLFRATSLSCLLYEISNTCICVCQYGCESVYIIAVKWISILTNLCQDFTLLVCLCAESATGVQNPMKMSDIVFLKTGFFLKTEPNWSQNSKTENCFRSLVFKKPTSAVWGWFFTLSHSVHLPTR